MVRSVCCRRFPGKWFRDEPDGCCNRPDARREAGVNLAGLDDPEEEQDEDDGEDETDSAATVVAESWTHSIATKGEEQDQDDKDNKHSVSPMRRIITA